MFVTATLGANKRQVGVLPCSREVEVEVVVGGGIWMS